MDALLKFDLGVSLIIFGHDNFGHPRIFEVHNPGRAFDLTWRGYALVGSGSTLAWGSIAHQPLPSDWAGLAYRLLVAKFVSEDAGSTVGKTTSAILLAPEGKGRHDFSEREIGKIRAAWMRERKRPPPKAALDVIRANEVLRHILRG
jgi:hypothetical protein